MSDCFEDNQYGPQIKAPADPNDSPLNPSLRSFEMTEPNEPRSRLRVAAILLALALSLFIAALDMTIVATAIPTISSELHSASGYLWIGGAYLLANAAGAPVWAKISDIWGRKPILLVAVAMFLGSSIMCALANSMEMLIVARALQGTAGGGLLGLVNIVISDIFSMRQRSLFLGLCECIWAIAGGVGPILGGTFTQLVSWRWIFWVNVPFSSLAFLLLLLFLNVHNPKTSFYDGVRAIDWFGSLSIIGLTVMLLLGLNFGGTTFPWGSPKVICLIIFGCLMSILFVFSERWIAKHPLMPLHMMGERSNLMSMLVGFLHGVVFVGAEYYMPLYFQSVEQASPLRSGVLILPFILSETAMGITAGVVMHKTGRYLELMWAGMAVLTLGIGMLINLSATSPLSQIVGFQIVGGLGSGLMFEPPLIAIQAHVSQEDTATATATLGFVRNLGTSVSVVVGGVIFQNSMRLRAPDLLSAGLSAEVAHQYSAGDAAANVMLIRTITNAAQRLAVKQAYAWSLRNLWILYTCVAFLGLVATAFVRKRKLSREHVETRTGLSKAGVEHQR